MEDPSCGTTLWSKIAAVHAGTCTWETADTILVLLMAAWVLFWAGFILQGVVRVKSFGR